MSSFRYHRIFYMLLHLPPHIAYRNLAYWTDLTSFQVLMDQLQNPHNLGMEHVRAHYIPSTFLLLCLRSYHT